MSVSQLFKSRALLQARLERNRSEKIGGKLEVPHGQILAYSAQLLKLTKQWQLKVLEEISPQLESSKDFKTDAIDPRLEKSLDQLRKEIDAFLDRAGIGAIVDLNINKILTFSSRQVARSLGIPIPEASGLGALIDRFREENLELIRKPLIETTQRLSETLENGQGLRVEEIRAQIQRDFDVSRSRATLIARDQTLKMNAQVTRQRQMEVGVTRYKWVISNDERVRPGHYALRDQIFSWTKPPIVDPKTGRRCHPGEDYQCRCTATPVLTGILD